MSSLLVYKQEVGMGPEIWTPLWILLMSILSFPFESKETLDLCELQLAQELLVAYMWKKTTNLKGAVNGCGWNMNLLISFLLTCVCYLKRFQIFPPAM